MARGKRDANMELLRILAMIMVVIMHFLSHSDSLISLDFPLSSTRILGSVLECFCLVAVNVYVLISGFYGVKKGFKPSRAVSLLAQIWFYTLTVFIVLWILRIPTIAGKEGIYGWIQYLFPIETEHYWFGTSYFMLYLLTPVLNRGVKALTQKQFKIVLLGLFLLFSGIKSISPVVFAYDRYGYDLLWFICIYLLGAYCSLYGLTLFQKRGAWIYLGSVTVSFGINFIMKFLADRNDSFAYYFTVPYHYNFVFCLTGALGLFYAFSRIQIKEGKLSDGIRKIAPLSFGVYLLHEHIDVRYLWYGWISELHFFDKLEGVPGFVLELFISVILVFLAGILVDYLRSLLFKCVKKPVFLQRWDDAFSEESL